MSWSAGKVLNIAVDNLNAKSINDKLSEGVNSWAESQNPRLEFPDPLFTWYESNENTSARLELSRSISSEEIPDISIWEDALLESYVSVRARLGDGCHEFYKQEVEEISDSIKELARILHQVCLNDESFFKKAVIDSIEYSCNQNVEILDGVNEISLDVKKLVGSLNDRKGVSQQGISEIEKDQLESLVCSKSKYSFDDKYFISRKLSATQMNSLEGSKEYSLSELIKARKEKRIVVLGFAGNGKSVELQKVRSEFSNQESIYYPIAIDLGNNDFKKDGVLGYFTKEFPGWDQLNNGLVIIIDGLDEVTENDIDDVRREIQDLGRSKDKAVIVVSCRNNFYLIEEESINGSLTGFNSYYLPQFDDSQVYEYVSRRIDAVIDKNLFFKELDRTGLKSDQFTPFYLVNLVGYFLEQEHSLPSTKTELFEYLIDRKKRNEKAKSFVRRSIINSMEFDLDEAIEKAAFVFQCVDSNSLSNKELSRIIRDEKLLEIIKYCYVLDHGGKERWSFDHNNFKEYLAAKYLSKQTFDFIQNTLFVNEINKIRPRWLNTLGFLISILDNNNKVYAPLVNHLKNNDPESLVRIEKDKIELPIREGLFLEIFEDYVEKGRRPYSPKFSTDDLGYLISDSRDICEYLIEQITPDHGRVRIDLSLYLLVRNEYWQTFRSKIEARIVNVLFDSKVLEGVKISCLNGLKWFGIVDEILINRLFNELALGNADLRHAVYYYVRNSEFIEDHFSFVWRCYIKSNRIEGDVKYVILSKIERPASFVHIVRSLRNGDANHKHDEFQIVKSTINCIMENKITSDELNDEVYLFFKTNDLLSRRDTEFVNLLSNYIDIFSFREIYVKRFLNEYFEKNDEDTLYGLAHLLNISIVKMLLSKLNENDTPLNQLRVMRNVLSWSKDKNAFDMLYGELNILTNNELIWSDNENSCINKQKYEEQIKFLLDKQYFTKYIESVYSSLNIEKLILKKLYSNDRTDWSDPKLVAFRGLMNYFQNGFSLTRSELLEYIYREEDCDYFIVSHLWKILNSDCKELIGDKENSFLKEWTYKYATVEFLKKTFIINSSGNWSYSNIGFYVAFFCHHYDLKLNRGVYSELINLDCSLIPSLAKETNDDWYFRNIPIKDSPLLTYILKETDESFVENKIVNNLQKEDLYEEVVHHHLRFLRKRRLEKHRELFLKVNLEKYKLLSLVCYTELGGDLNVVIKDLSEIDWRENWVLIDAIIKQSKDVLIPYLKEELSKADDREYEMTLITNLLKCESPIGLVEMKNWILKNGQFPGKSWADLANKIDSGDKLEVIKAVYSDSIQRNYGGDRSFGDRRSYLTILLELGKQNENSYKEVSELFIELIDNYPEQIFLHEVISNFEFDYYKNKSHAMKLGEVLELI